MREFSNFYRRHPELNLTGFSQELWKKQKERDYRVWKAALEWVLKELEYKYETSAPGDGGWQGTFIEEELENHD